MAGAAVLGRRRGELLDRVTGLLRADPQVEGVALTGSLGRGEGDDWSDIDLLVLMADREVAAFAADPPGRAWARADLVVDGRHNSPAGATSVGATHVLSGLPVLVDLHVHPVERTAWPVDGRVLFQRRAVGTGTASFAELNGRGPRQAPTVKTADEVRKIRLSYVPVAGKYVARRSAAAVPMIRFLGERPAFGASDPAAQLAALREIAAGLADPSWAWLSDAVAAHLELVEATC